MYQLSVAHINGVYHPIKRQPRKIRCLLAMNCLGVFDHLVGITLKELIPYQTSMKEVLPQWLMASNC